MPRKRFPNELDRIRDSILRGLIITLLIFGLPSIGIALINTKHSGSFPYITIISYISFLIIFIFYKKISIKIIAWLLILTGYLLGTRGLLNEGLLSHGMMFYLMITMLAAMLINIKASSIIMGLNLLTATLVTLAINQKWIKYNFSMEEYFFLPSTWIGFILVLFIFSFISMMIYRSLENNLKKYTEEIVVTSENLRQSNQRLESEVTERQKAQVQLIQNETKFRNVFNSIKDGILLCDSKNNILDANNAISEMTGYIHEELVKMNIKELFTNYDYLDIPSFNTSEFSRLNKNEMVMNNQSGLIPVELSVAPFINQEEHLFIAVIKDIHDRKAIEHRIYNAMIESEEKERKRIAQELHDGIGPLLSAAKLYASSAEINTSSNKGMIARKELMNLLSQAVSTIREISGNLSSHILLSMGLKNALIEFIRTVDPTESLKVKLFLINDLAFKENVLLSIYRAFEELLNNTIKYSKAKNVTIKMDESNDHIIFTYTDDGVGFDFNKTKKDIHGMGIYNIHSRIQSMGGTVDFKSSSGKGVTVIFTLPKKDIKK